VTCWMGRVSSSQRSLLGLLDGENIVSRKLDVFLGVTNRFKHVIDN
jgi:hypothetical protein